MTIRRPIPVDEMLGRMRGRAANSSPPSSSVRQPTTAKTIPKTPVRVWSPAEIWQPLEPPTYAIGGLVLSGNLALLVAYGSSFKSWMAIDLLVAKATGSKWLGLFDCEAAPALLVDWENDDYEDRRRFQADARARGLEGPVDGVHMVSLPSFFFTSKDFESIARDLAAKHKLIVWDTLSAGSPDVEENDTRFAVPLNILKRIGPELGCKYEWYAPSQRAYRRTSTGWQVRKWQIEASRFAPGKPPFFNLHSASVWRPETGLPRTTTPKRDPGPTSLDRDA